MKRTNAGATMQARNLVKVKEKRTVKGNTSGGSRWGTGT